MSIQAVGWVLENSEARLGARLVLLALANHANKDGGSCYPSIDTIASEARMSRRQVQNSLRELVRIGELTIARNASPFGTNDYRIIMRQALQDDTALDGVIPDDTEGGANIAPLLKPVEGRNIEPADAQNRTKGGAKSDQNGGRILHPNRHSKTVKEPSLTGAGDKPPASPLHADNEEPAFRTRKIKVTRKRLRELIAKYNNLSQATIIDELTELDRIWSEGGGGGGGPRTQAEQWQRIYARLKRMDREAYERINAPAVPVGDQREAREERWRYLMDRKQAFTELGDDEALADIEAAIERFVENAE